MNTYILRYRYPGKTVVYTEHCYDDDFVRVVRTLCNLFHVKFLQISRVS